MSVRMRSKRRLRGPFRTANVMFLMAGPQVSTQVSMPSMVHGSRSRESISGCSGEKIGVIRPASKERFFKTTPILCAVLAGVDDELSPLELVKQDCCWGFERTLVPNIGKLVDSCHAAVFTANTLFVLIGVDAREG